MIRRTYKFRIYPTKAQIARVGDTLALCRELYNAALQERRDAWRLNRVSISYYQQASQLPEIKQLRPELNDVHSQVLQDVLRRLDKAFVAFFRRMKSGDRPGFPRFRSAARYDSFTYPQGGFTLKDGKLRLSKIGKVKIRQHREIEGKIKTLTISRASTGKWFACFTAECESSPLPESGTPVGVDVGLTHFATLSTGERIANPRFFRAGEKSLAKAQWRLSLEKKGTLGRAKRRKIVARVHERIANRRHDFAHQLSRALVSVYGVIAFEDLRVRNMMRNRRLAKSIQDAAWSQLIQFTTYKAVNAGKTVRLVDPCGTSQRCSGCQTVVAKDLSERVHHCACGLTLDRDHNAALNILSLGLQAAELTTPGSPAL